MGEVITGTSRFMSAHTVHEQLRQRGRDVSLSTVYRHLRTMAHQGLLDVITNEAGRHLHRHCLSARPHHHLVCQGCGLGVEIDSTPLEAWSAQIAAARFVDLAQLVEVHGICLHRRNNAQRDQS